MRSLVDTLKTELQEKSIQLENLTRLHQPARYKELRKKAEGLVAEAKISTAEFNDIFSEGEADIARLLKASNEESNTELTNIEFYLSKSAMRSPSIFYPAGMDKNYRIIFVPKKPHFLGGAKVFLC